MPQSANECSVSASIAPEPADHRGDGLRARDRDVRDERPDDLVRAMRSPGPTIYLIELGQRLEVVGPGSLQQIEHGGFGRRDDATGALDSPRPMRQLVLVRLDTASAQACT